MRYEDVFHLVYYSSKRGQQLILDDYEGVLRNIRLFKAIGFVLYHIKLNDRDQETLLRVYKDSNATSQLTLKFKLYRYLKHLEVDYSKCTNLHKDFIGLCYDTEDNLLKYYGVLKPYVNSNTISLFSSYKSLDFALDDIMRVPFGQRAIKGWLSAYKKADYVKYKEMVKSINISEKDFFHYFSEVSDYFVIETLSRKLDLNRPKYLKLFRRENVNLILEKYCGMISKQVINCCEREYIKSVAYWLVDNHCKQTLEYFVKHNKGYPIFILMVSYNRSNVECCIKDLDHSKMKDKFIRYLEWTK